MFSKEEKSALNHSFWNEFKNSMKKSSSQLQRRVNWVQYPTHLRHTYLRLIFDQEKAAVCYDIQFKDEEIRVLFWEQLIELRTLIENNMGVSTIWIQNFETNEGVVISRLKWQDCSLNLHQKRDWKKACIFFKERLLEFDAFYQEYKEILINLIK
tara:strand:- start:176 stop:640 length:465 start_codon:yes stop_codon:yes gene_type:complete